MHNPIQLVPWLLAASPSLINVAKEASALYRDLEQAGVSHKFSQTVKFSYVPPVKNGESWRDEECIEVEVFDTSLMTDQDSNDKPIALYLPGLDGFGISAAQQYDDMSRAFEFWRMVVSTSDRSSYGDLTAAVTSFIDQVAVKRNRKIILIGESFGGLLAPGVSMRVKTMALRQGVQNPIIGLVMINPATSFDSSNWSILGPALASLRHADNGNNGLNLPTPYSIAGGVTLAQRIPDLTQLRKITNIVLGAATVSPTEMLSSMGDGFSVLEKQLPAETIEHRISRWLSVGSDVVNSRLSEIDLPALVVFGRDDNMLPSQEEANRLIEKMPNTKMLEVAGAGHFVLDDRVNLTEAIEFSHIDPFSYKSRVAAKDPIVDWMLPHQEEVKDIIDIRVKPLRQLTSPVFFSTDKMGRRRKGLSCLPTPGFGPILFVANHQFGGLDLSMIIAELLEERGIAARGLAHPIIFGSRATRDNNNFPGPGAPGVRQEPGNAFSPPFGEKLFEKFGAVVVTPRNYYRLMQTGQTALLFPGGVREVFHGKHEAYKLFWPETVDFVRTAAKFNATVVPLSALGAADSYNILVDAPDMAKLPFGIGERVRNSSANITSARFNMDDEEELFAAPFALPRGLPARHYFVFGKPMSTTEIDFRDKEGCQRFYEHVKDEMNRGFDDVLRARTFDPFSNSLQRIAYEQLTGKQAPTFPVHKLSR